MRRVALLVLALLCSPAWADSGSQAPPVTSVTGQTGAVQLPTVCGNVSTGSAIGGTSAETAFAPTCTIPANTIKAGLVIYLHVGGIYTAATANAATGRVRYTNGAAQNLATDPTPVSTGSLNGVAGANGAQWIGDLFITFTSDTTFTVQSELLFQATTPFQVFLPNSTVYTIDRTKDLTFYLTVQWSTNSTGNSMLLQSMVAK